MTDAPNPIRYAREGSGHTAECLACRDWVIWDKAEKPTRDAAAAHEKKCKEIQ